jgi:UDP-glucuronate decarboxylase
VTRVLVTGGAGFIGSHLCERLIAGGHDVICLDDLSTGDRRHLDGLIGGPRFTLRVHDVIEPFAADVDAVYHLACPASPVHYQRDPVRTLRTCVEGTLRALACAAAAGAPLFLASTSEVYGDPVEHPQREAYLGNVNPIGPRACYTEGKRCAEALAASYARQHGVDVRIARIFNTYGPRMPRGDGRVVANFVEQALAGAPITVHGDGQQTRSFCYVDDLIDGIVALMALPPGPRGEVAPVNLGNPSEITVGELAALVCELAGSPSTIARVERPIDDPARRRPDITLARRLLGWDPAISLREGVQRTLRWCEGAGR